MPDIEATAADSDAWNPGITSPIPRELLHLSTIFRADNVFTSMETAVELHGITGLSASELIEFRPQRLMLHEVLIRVTADFEVPDGLRIGDLGINFRKISSRLLAAYVIPELPSILRAYAAARRELEAATLSALASVLPERAAARGKVRLFSRWRRHPAQPVVRRDDRDWGPSQLAMLDQQSAAATDGLKRLVCRTLAQVMAALFKTHGQAWGTREVIAALTRTIAGNAYLSDAVGRALDPVLRAGAEREGYRLLPRQDRPIVINTKGASASGKSTLRPLHKQLASDIGVRWADFALISPDIWRKQLLDYATLGSNYKYAGAFTAEEVQIVDRKLDLYMTRKHERGEMTHLLIDRFRFDSFAPDSDEAGSNLLTRFGQTVYLFFVVTPPELLVERAWKRGLEFGRYKALDDTLGHSVEAYQGIADVFFTWARRTDKTLLYEFLDNTVPLGARPRTIAFGDNGTLNVLDVSCLCNIQRYRDINVNARNPDTLYASPGLLAAERNTQFLNRCVREFAGVNFADQASGRVYLRVEAGKVAWTDGPRMDTAMAEPDTFAAISAACPALEGGGRREGAPCYLDHEAFFPTLGEWGTWRQP